MFYYFAKWQSQWLCERIHRALRDGVRLASGKKKPRVLRLSAARGAKVAEQPGERGYDAGKKINERKRHVLVDTLGLILAVVVHSAALQDCDGAKLLACKILPKR